MWCKLTSTPLFHFRENSGENDQGLARQIGGSVSCVELLRNAESHAAFVLVIGLLQSFLEVSWDKWLVNRRSSSATFTYAVLPGLTSDHYRDGLEFVIKQAQRRHDEEGLDYGSRHWFWT